MSDIRLSIEWRERPMNNFSYTHTETYLRFYIHS